MSERLRRKPSLKDLRQDQRLSETGWVRAEIKLTGTSKQYGDTLALYDKLLNKARDGHLGPRKLEQLQGLKAQLREAFNPQGATDVYIDWVNAAPVRRKNGQRVA